MGYADGYYYGQGRIICDTSTFSVGDTIRVRSMTDSNKVWNKQVVTVGTALVFTVPCYDYYKICTVQDIGGTPTEIGGVYKTVDFGQTLFINMLDKTTLGGIQGILNAHQETTLLNIGDEVNVTISGVDEPYILSGLNLYNSHEAIFVSKYLSESGFSAPSGNYSARTDLINYLSSVYSNMAEKDKQFIKDKTVNAYSSNGITSIPQKVWIPTYYEVFGDFNSEASTNSRFPIFVSQNNRIKVYKSNLTANYWQLASGYIHSSYAEYVNASGGSYNGLSNTPSVNCFHLTADV